MSVLMLMNCTIGSSHLAVFVTTGTEILSKLSLLE